MSNGGLTLWWDTGDAPAPALEVYERVPTPLTLAAQPPHPLHSVSVRYRVDGGRPATLQAWTTSTDLAANVQYFHTRFPAFQGDHTVEYTPLLSSAGRQVPVPPLDQRYPSSFRVIRAPALDAPAPAPSASQPYAHTTEVLCRVEAQLRADPELVGETPEGLRVNFFVDGGRLSGARLNGKIHSRGVDSMLIRRDGVGLVRVRATIETLDGALLDADYTGLIELGPDGYARAAQRRFPDVAEIQLAPRLLTGHPGYAWINRMQLMGLGRVMLKQNLVSYDLIAFRLGG
jgi:hypothetical protein